MAREHPDVTKAAKEWPAFKRAGWAMVDYARWRGLDRGTIYKAIQRKKKGKK